LLDVTDVGLRNKCTLNIELPVGFASGKTIYYFLIFSSLHK
jgi:hypothetical protein